MRFDGEHELLVRQVAEMAIVTKGAVKIYCSGGKICQQNIWKEKVLYY